MGSSKSRYAQALEPLCDAKGEARQIVMLGLEDAGKTTIMYSLGLGEVVRTLPFEGFMLDTVECGALTVQSWDVGSRMWFRALWTPFLQRTQGLIYVVDSTADEEGLAEARDELARIVQVEPMNACVLLVFANKMDEKKAATTTAIASALALETLPLHDVLVQQCCAPTMAGVAEGLQWLATALVKRTAAAKK